MSNQMVIAQDWRTILGNAFGFNQSVLTGTLVLPQETLTHARLLHEVLVAIFATPQFNPVMPTSNLELSHFILLSCREIQKRARLSVFETGRVIQIKHDVAGIHAQLALPFSHAGSAFNALRWVVEVMNMLGRKP